MLTRNRIWGNVVGGNTRSGFKELKAPLKGPRSVNLYEFALLKDHFPFLKDWSKENLLKEKYSSRKMRIFMRGMKIGQQKGKGQMAAMSVFDMKKGSPADL